MSATRKRNQNPANVDRQIVRAIEERRTFLQDQVAWRERVQSLIAQMKEAARKNSPEDAIAKCQVLMRKVPEASETVMPLVTQLKQNADAYNIADRQRHDRKTVVDEASIALGISLLLPDERKSSRTIQQHQKQTNDQLTLVEKRQAWWDRICGFFPNFVVELLLSGFRKRLQAEIDEKRSTLEQLSSLATRLAEWSAAHSKCEETSSDLRRTCKRVAESSKNLKRVATQILNHRVKEHTETLQEQLHELPPFYDAQWIPERWDGFDHNAATPPSHVVIGHLAERPTDILGSTGRLYFSVLLPFIGGGHHLLIECQKDSENTSHNLFLSLMVRTLMMLPHHSRCLLLDPKGQGRACPFANLFPSIECQTVKLHDALDGRVSEISRIIHDYIDDRVSSFEQLPFAARMNEKFEFIFVASFPEDYDRRSIELLQRISKNGAVAGKYLIIEWQADVPMPHGVSLNEFANVKSVDPNHLPLPPIDTSGFDVGVDTLPHGDFLRHLSNALSSSKPPETTVEWQDVIKSSKDEWWTHDATDRIETSIGIAGRSNELKLWFGANQDNRPCAHGMLGAMTGSGKSNLYHVLICGLATRYSPKELRLYLIDGKDGVEFQAYKDLPHSAAVSLNTAPELARSILDELLAEKERRNTLFAEAGVPDLASYRRKRLMGPALPRILLLVDEYQELLEDDREGTASARLLQLAQQGRNVGIHMLLGSQRFGVTGLLHQTAIFGNIHLRIAMKIAAADITALTEFGSAGKRLIRNCDLPGKIVVNDDSGGDQANRFGKVALLPRERVDDLIVALRDKEQSLAVETRSLPSVFNGKSQPLLLENAQFRRVLSTPHRLSPEEWERYARRPLHEHGLGEEGWYSGELPSVMWVGQELNMYGHAHVIVRRQPMENILLVGGNHAARYGMLASMLASLSCAASGTPPPVVRVVDFSPPGTPWNGLLARAVDDLLVPIGYDAQFVENSAGLTNVIDEMTDEMIRRIELSEAEKQAVPSACLFLGEAGKFHELRKKPGKFGGLMGSSELGKKLYHLCAGGPALGIHVVLGFSTFASVLQIADRQQIEGFRHRIALQMSEEDAFTFIRSRTASRLQVAGTMPILALYGDIVAGCEKRFKPYSIDSADSASEIMQHIRSEITRWETQP